MKLSCLYRNRECCKVLFGLQFSITVIFLITLSFFKCFQYSTIATTVGQFDSSVMIKATISLSFFAATVKGLGSPEQQKYVDDIAEEKVRII